MSPKKSRKTRWAGYVRVSKVGGRSGERYISPEQQREQIERWAEYRGVNLVAIYVDEDQSGGKMARKQFNELMASAEGGEIDGIVVAKVDRFARTLVGALVTLEKMAKWGVEFTSVAENIDTSTSQGKMFLRMMLVFAEFELDRIRDQWQDATTRAVGRGVFVRKGEHFGYAKDENGRLHIDDDSRDAAVVRELFRRRAQRQTWAGLADWLNTERPREDGRRWTHQRVISIIQSRSYLGESGRGEIVNREAHDPIVTLAEWQAANEVNGGPGAVSDVDPPLLAELLRCASCRYGMRRVYSPVKHKDGTVTKIEGYTCGRKHTAGICPAPAYVKAEDVEEVVLAQFGWWHFHTTREPYRPDLRRLQEVEGQLGDLIARRDAMLDDDDLRDRVGREAFLAGIDRRQQDIAAKEAERDQLAAGVEIDKHRPIMLADEWNELNREQQRAILRRAIDSVYVRRADGRRKRDLLDLGWDKWLNADVFDRTLIKWSGEDDLDHPERGRRDYTIASVPWPEAVPKVDLTAEARERGEDVAEGVRISTGGPHTTMMLANRPAWTSDPRAGEGLDLPVALQAALSGIVERGQLEERANRLRDHLSLPLDVTQRSALEDDIADLANETHALGDRVRALKPLVDPPA